MHLRRKIFYAALIVAVVLFGATTAYAATTIGNNVSVGGTLGVTGLLTPTGGISTSTLDNMVIGGSTAAAGTFSTLVVNTTVAVDTNTFVVNSTSNKVGIVSSTPMGQISIGAGLGVSSTISTGKFCMYAGQENGVMVYVVLGANQPANQPFATTTVSCF